MDEVVPRWRANVPGIMAALGAVTSMGSLAAVWFRIPTAIEWPVSFAGYQVAYLGPLLACFAAVSLAGIVLGLDKVVIASGSFILGAAAVFAVWPVAVAQETWRWHGGTECMWRCDFMRWEIGVVIAAAGGVLVLVGGLLQWRSRRLTVTGAGPQTSARV